MRLGQIDINKKPSKPELYLCKPNKQVIRPLKDIYNVQLNINLGKVNEVVFTVPTQIERKHQLVDNPLIDEIRHRYLIKVIYNNLTEYFVHFQQNKVGSDSDKYATYTSYSTGYMLKGHKIRDYQAESKSLSYIATDILKETNWSIGYVDADFDLKARQFEVPNQNALQAIYDLAEKFNALIVWDTINLKINFYKPQNIGMNKGFKLKEGKYLESFDYNSNSDDMPTRLKLYGSEGLSIRRLTPTGMNYIEDYSYYTYPFERDENGNVIQKSKYMSDELCIALEDYNNALDGLQGQFDLLTSQLKTKQDELQQKTQELSVLETELKILVDESDVLNREGKSGTPEHTTVLNKISAKENQMTIKQNEINTVNGNITSLNTQLSTLRTSASMETYLTRDQLLELNESYVITEEYTNDTIIDDEDLLKEGIEAFIAMREPKVNLTLDLANFLSVVEAQNDWDKLGLGDTVALESKQLRLLITAKIIGISHIFDDNKINLTIANEKEIRDSDARLLAKLYSASNTSTIVNMDKYKWDMIEEANNLVSQLLNSNWDAVKNNIVAGYKQDIIIGERGIVIKSPENPLDVLVIQSGMLAISNDGMNTWKHAITADGIIADRLIGKLVMSNRMIIEDDNGVIRLSGSLQEIFDQNGNVKVAIGKYADNKYGMRIDSGSLEIVGGLTENQLNQSIKDKLQEANGVRADLRLTAPLPTNLTLNGEGITATVTGSPSKFARMDYRGLYIQGGALDIRTSATTNSGVAFNGLGISAYNSGGTRTFYVDTNGNLTATSATINGHINATSGTFSGSLQAATGTFSGSLNAATGSFSGTLNAASGSFSGALNGATGTFGGLYTGTINADQFRGSSFTVGYGTGSTMTLTSTYGAHVLSSSDSAGMAIQSSNSLSLRASGYYGVYVPYSPLVAGSGFRVEGGVSQFNTEVTVNSTLKATTLYSGGYLVATQQWVGSQLYNYATTTYVNSQVSGRVTTSEMNSAINTKANSIYDWVRLNFVAK
ncbi:phage tail protein [Bacillus sp. FJAT-22090]|uniref:phage tail protein n=1 Tax=Bacillus sp. FJAT-22090 TaxID=1581038 RepID=UPI00164266C7|nr:phage tail protein [Bacillus sp. FJAT-22090]